mgnify:CR=1 FL=1
MTYQIKKTLLIKQFVDGAVVYDSVSGETIQLDNISGCLLDKLFLTPCNLDGLIRHLEEISANEVSLSEPEILQYINALIDNNLVAECSIS